MGECLGKIGVITTATLSAIATAHHNELADSSALYSLHYFIGYAENLMMRKAAHNRTMLNLRRGLAGFCQSDNLTKVFIPLLIASDILKAGVAR